VRVSRWGALALLLGLACHRPAGTQSKFGDVSRVDFLLDGQPLAVLLQGAGR
jgi:hypothetical protein